jgi:hypothetical protein
MSEDPPTTTREVRSQDPSLTAQANADVTAELREAVGADRVEVSTANADHRRDRNATGSPLAAPFSDVRLGLAVTGLVVAIVLGIVGIAAGGTWALIGVFLALVLGLGALVSLVLRMTTEQEHLSPETVAELEAQGVVTPDHAFNELVQEFADDPKSREAHDVVTPGSNDRTTRPEVDPSTATAEQRTSMTPSSQATSPVGPGDDS